MPKAAPSASQLTLSLFDSTSLGWGLSLDAPASTGPKFREAELPDEAPSPPPATPRVPAHTYCLAGDRRLAANWKGRATDTIAAIRLMQEIEAEGRHATPEEQERLALFTGFGASDLANSLPRRRGVSGRLGGSRQHVGATGLAGGNGHPRAGDAIICYLESASD